MGFQLIANWECAGDFYDDDDVNKEIVFKRLLYPWHIGWIRQEKKKDRKASKEVIKSKMWATGNGSDV